MQGTGFDARCGDGPYHHQYRRRDETNQKEVGCN